MDGENSETFRDSEKRRNNVIYGIMEADLTDNTLLTLGDISSMNITIIGGMTYLFLVPDTTLIFLARRLQAMTGSLKE
ncbi:hypothetical protein PRR79_28690, partial [Klebsiella pneumoniae]|nr:hypothetical protein [Klebsiella pneumoniae]